VGSYWVTVTRTIGYDVLLQAETEEEAVDMAYGLGEPLVSIECDQPLGDGVTVSDVQHTELA